jgi:hypothetical protein
MGVVPQPSLEQMTPPRLIQLVVHQFREDYRDAPQEGRENVALQDVLLQVPSPMIELILHHFLDKSVIARRKRRSIRLDPEVPLRRMLELPVIQLMVDHSRVEHEVALQQLLQSVMIQLIVDHSMN